MAARLWIGSGPAQNAQHPRIATSRVGRPRIFLSAGEDYQNSVERDLNLGAPALLRVEGDLRAPLPPQDEAHLHLAPPRDPLLEPEPLRRLRVDALVALAAEAVGQVGRRDDRQPVAGDRE